MADIVIIGGGLAGAACAIELRKAGLPVTLIEKETKAHDKVCGEFFSSLAITELEALGVDPSVFGGPAIDHVAMAHGQTYARTKLPFEALSLRRRDIDTALLDLAEHAGAKIIRGSRAVDICPDGRRVWLAGGDELSAGKVVLASGKHDLKATKRGEGLHDTLVGLKWYLKQDQALNDDIARTVELLFFNGGYAGLQPSPNGLLNLTLVIEKDALQRVGRSPHKALDLLSQGSDRAADVLACCAPVDATPFTIAQLPYGYTSNAEDNIYRIGDQAGVIASAFGEGMAIALTTGRDAAEAIASGASAQTFSRKIRKRIAMKVRLSGHVSRALVKPASQALVARSARFTPALIRFLADRSRAVR